MKSLVLAGLCLVIGCGGGGEVAVREVLGNSPIDRITLVDTRTDGRRINLHLEPEASWQALVDLTAFDGFSPSMSHEDARTRIGPPDEIDGAQYIYYRPRGRIVVALVRDRSGNSIFEQWQTRLEPAESRLRDYFTEKLADQIEPVLRERSVLVLLHPSEYGPILRVRINGGEIESITWYRE